MFRVSEPDSAPDGPLPAAAKNAARPAAPLASQGPRQAPRRLDSQRGATHRAAQASVKAAEAALESGEACIESTLDMPPAAFADDRLREHFVNLFYWADEQQVSLHAALDDAEMTFADLADHADSKPDSGGRRAAEGELRGAKQQIPPCIFAVGRHPLACSSRRIVGGEFPGSTSRPAAWSLRRAVREYRPDRKGRHSNRDSAA